MARPKGSKSAEGTTPPGKRASYLITWPNGHHEVTDNLREFCRANKLSRSGLNRVLSGEYNSWKGFDIIHFG